MVSNNGNQVAFDAKVDEYHAYREQLRQCREDVHRLSRAEVTPDVLESIRQSASGAVGDFREKLKRIVAEQKSRSKAEAMTRGFGNSTVVYHQDRAIERDGMELLKLAERDLDEIWTIVEAKRQLLDRTVGA